MTYEQIFSMVFNSIGVALLCSILLTFMYHTFIRKLRKRSMIFYGVFYFYVSMLILVTVVRIGLNTVPVRSINLTLFDELIKANHYQNVVNGPFQALALTGYNVFGNIVWFIPFGFFLAYQAKTTWYKTLLFTFLLSLSIEILQYVVGSGVSDVDDLLFNVIGGCIGYAIYQLCMRGRRKHVN